MASEPLMCKCGRRPTRHISGGGGGGVCYTYACDECGIAASDDRYESVAVIEWNRLVRTSRTKEPANAE